MSKAKFADPILQTIDQLRSRKARPDLVRICHMVERQHGLSADDVRSNLAIMVAENTVMKVNYKGNISYRNPEKWKRRKREEVGESSARKTVPVIRAKHPKKKLLKLKAVKVLSKPKGKRGRPPLKSKLKIKPPPSDVDEETEEEVLDNSLIKNAGDDESVATLVIPKQSDSKANKKEIEKSDTEVFNETSTDDASGSRSAKASVSKNFKASVKNEAAKVKNDDGKSASIAAGSEKHSSTESDHETSETASTSAGTVVPATAIAHKLESAGRGFRQKKIKLVANKRKKFKKNLGSEFQYPPVKRARYDPSEKGSRRSSSSSAEKESKELKCDYCLLTASNNRNGQPEDLLICKDCQAKAHPSCMDYSEELARRACRSPWQCIDCKTCNVCNDSGDADTMLFCDECDKGYHMNCHHPSIKEKPTGNWICCRCVLELGGETDHQNAVENNEMDNDVSMDESIHAADGGGASCLPTPNESPVHFTEEADRNKMSSKLSSDIIVPLPRLSVTLKNEVPDASEWSIVDVVKFFADMGFTEQAEAFMEQEIDGRALLLMTRMDVLTGLSIKLGPALKIYVHVERLQTKHLNSH